MDTIIKQIHQLTASLGRTIRLMEVCGTHTVAIFRHGIRNILPGGITLLSGPGCPVCVTAVRDVETAIALSSRADVVLTTFGDMMRVPGIRGSLLDAKASGGDVRIVYSPLDALEMAAQQQDRKVVFFATGFETTSPSVAGTILEAERRGISNFFIYPVHKTVPPALRALMDSGEVLVDGFILPGHVSTVIGSRPYGFIASQYKRASVITGFDAKDILSGICMILQQLARGEARVEIQYARVVREEGNPRAVAVLEECFEPEDAHWRGIGVIPGSGLRLKQQYRHRDIRSVYDPAVADVPEATACSCGEVLKGVKTPVECKLFGKGCTPEHPVGPCMVSSEGSCAAFYKYQAVRGV